MSTRKVKQRVMNNDVWLLRESVVKITQMLTGQGLLVTQRGVSASVKCDKDGKPVAINLPYIPDNATEELCQAIQGFLDKEVSTVLYTDFTEMKKVDKNKPLHNMAKLIEDARVEKEMARHFRGSASNCASTSQFFLDKYTTPKLTEATVGGDDDAAIALLMHPLIRSMSGLNVEKDYMSTKMGIVADVYDKIKSVAARMEANTSTAGSIALAQEVRKLMLEEDPEEDEGDGEGDGEGGGGAGAGGAGEGGGGGEGGAAGEADWENLGEGGGKGASAMLDAIDKENANSFDQTMSRLISDDAMETAKEAQYLVYTKDSDVIEPMVVGSGYKSEMFSKGIEEAVEHMVGPLQKDLERAITARSMAIWENGRRSGRLHSANLARMASGDTRVFRRKHESRSKDVAVTLLVDASGSMGGARIVLATQAAYALSAVLERLRITHEVICFTTGPIAGGDHAAVQAEEAKMGRSFTRDESLYMPILKGFNERLGTDTKSRFGWLPNSRILRNNVDGECVEIAARRLLSQPQNGKILMVLSDGSPNASGDSGRLSSHLKEVVKETMNKGVNVIGIGIQTDSVQKYYPKNVVIHKAEDLPQTVIKELRNMLLN